MASSETRMARLRMVTGEGMYDFARINKVAGWPMLLAPMAWLAKKHFKNIEHSLADGEKIVVTFMAKMSGLSENNKKPRYKWYAFALSDAGTLYFAHWTPFHLDSLRMTLDQINTINPNTGLIRGTLQLQTLQGTQDITMRWFSVQIRRIYTLLNNEKHYYDQGQMTEYTRNRPIN